MTVVYIKLDSLCHPGKNLPWRGHWFYSIYFRWFHHGHWHWGLQFTFVQAHEWVILFITIIQSACNWLVPWVGTHTVESRGGISGGNADGGDDGKSLHVKIVVVKEDRGWEWMMLAIANEKIMREVKESLTTAVGCSDWGGFGWNFNTKATYNVANTACRRAYKSLAIRVEGENPWGWAEFQLSQFWRNKFHIFENNNTTPLTHTAQRSGSNDRCWPKILENGNLKRPMR